MGEKKSVGSDRQLGSDLARLCGSLFLLLFCPAFCLAMWWTNVHLDGSLLRLLSKISDEGLWGFLSHIWPSSTNSTALKLIGAYAAFELLLVRFVPGDTFHATMTQTGHVPKYKANGVLCYIISIATVLILPCVDSSFRPALIYDMMGELLSSMNVIALVFCLILYFKGLFAPSTEDCGSSGSFIVDYFWVSRLDLLSCDPLYCLLYA
jgi:7-dehydrocholesterol reductase